MDSAALVCARRPAYLFHLSFGFVCHVNTAAGFPVAAFVYEKRVGRNLAPILPSLLPLMPQAEVDKVWSQANSEQADEGEGMKSGRLFFQP